jgi:hypothetical protein
MDSRLLEVIDRDMWVGVLMSPEDFVELGFDEQKAKLYANVARQLHFRRELWN